MRHVKILLRKDFLTLKRNFMFFMTFIILPIAVMSGFNFLHSLVEGELAPERHNTDRKSMSRLFKSNARLFFRHRLL